jgi:Zn-dependent protease with chaperone function
VLHELKRYRWSLAKVFIAWMAVGVAAAAGAFYLELMGLVWVAGMTFVPQSYSDKSSWGYVHIRRLWRALGQPPMIAVVVVFGPFLWPALIRTPRHW